LSSPSPPQGNPSQAPEPTAPFPPNPDRRKAYRLGKFLQNVHGLRNASLWTAAGGGSRTEVALGVLEVVTFVGEGVYYFLDQFLWWAPGKGGLKSKRTALTSRF
jgi:hypothetical protein